LLPFLYRQSLPSNCPSSFDDTTAILCLHAGEESMFPQALAPFEFREHGERIERGPGQGQGQSWYTGFVGVRQTVTRLELVALLLLLLAVGCGAAVILGNVGSSSALRNQKRFEDVRYLENALTLYALEHDGRYPEGIEETAKPVCREDASSCEGMLDLRMLVPRYLERIPADPFAVGVDETFYTVSRAGKRIVVAAPSAEGVEVIRVER